MAENMILNGEGKPFGDKGSATRVIANKKLKDTHCVVTVDGGFAIAPVEASTSSSNEKVSGPVNTQREDDQQQPGEQLETEVKRFREPANEKYFRVMLPSKRNPSDPNYILASVNGESYHLQREMEMVLPGRFLKAWKNTNKPIYTKEPGKERTPRLFARNTAFCSWPQETF